MLVSSIFFQYSLISTPSQSFNFNVAKILFSTYSLACSSLSDKGWRTALQFSLIILLSDMDTNVVVAYTIIKASMKTDVYNQLGLEEKK